MTVKMLSEEELYNIAELMEEGMTYEQARNKVNFDEPLIGNPWESIMEARRAE